MARRKSKKSATQAPVAPSEQKTVKKKQQPQQAAQAQEARQAAVAPAVQPAPAAPPDSPPAAPHGMVRKGTFFMGMGFALVLGLYLGSLVPSLLQESASDSLPVRQAQAPEGMRAAPQADMPQISPQQAARVAELEKAVLENPQDAARWTSLGNLYFDIGQAQKAVTAYERSLALAPDNAHVLTDLGIMQRELGQFEKAVESFHKAAALQPDLENAHFNEGVVQYYDLNRKDAAVAAWKRLLRVNPDARAPDGQRVADLLQHLH